MQDLKVRFIPDGGFHKAGAFVEYEGDAPTGKETQFERQDYLTIDITCRDPAVGTQVTIINEFGEKERTDRFSSRTISAKGRIQPARWGQYSLSFFGSRHTFREVDVQIRESSQGEAVQLAGLNAISDLDLETDSSFFLQVTLQSDRFQDLLGELSKPGASLRLSADVDRFGGFYAEWSPSISEGRVLKFLDQRKDVENEDEIPEVFWLPPDDRKKRLSNPDMPPVSIWVARSLGTVGSVMPGAQVTSFDEADAIEDDDEALIAHRHEGAVQSDAVLAQAAATHELTKRVRRGAFWVSFWLAMLFVAAVLNLV